MIRINLELPGNRFVSFDDGGQHPERLAAFVENNYPDFKCVLLRNVPGRSDTGESEAIEVTEYQAKARSLHNAEEEPLLMPTINFSREKKAPKQEPPKPSRSEDDGEQPLELPHMF